MADLSGPSSAYFDQWYADMVGSSAKDEIMQRHFGLPSWLPSNSSLTWQGLAEVVGLLRLREGQVLLDLACGRGGYGMEAADRTGARLIGVDFSKEALRQARLMALRLGREASFRFGALNATGLASASVDGVMCIDSVQFAEPPQGVFEEIRRVLRPGGRVVVTCWQPVKAGDERVPFRLRHIDLDADLVTAGFADVQAVDRPAWRAAERSMWDEAADVDPGDDPALKSLRDEGVRSLRSFELIRRVLAWAEAP